VTKQFCYVMNLCRPTKRVARQFIRLSESALRAFGKAPVGLRPDDGRGSYTLFYAGQVPKVPPETKIVHKKNRSGVTVGSTGLPRPPRQEDLLKDTQADVSVRVGTDYADKMLAWSGSKSVG
jgi:hypothetical protein